MALDPRLYQELAAFRHALRQFLAFSDAILGDAGMTAQQYQVLLVVQTAAAEGISIRDLADQMLLQHHGAVRLIDHMEKDGLLVRRPSPSDGRSVTVALMPKGRRRLEELAAPHLDELLRHERLLADALRRLRQLSRPLKADWADRNAQSEP